MDLKYMDITFFPEKLGWLIRNSMELSKLKRKCA